MSQEEVIILRTNLGVLLVLSASWHNEIGKPRLKRIENDC